MGDLGAHPEPVSDSEFVHSLRETGGALIDLGATGRVHCERAVEEVEPYFSRGERVADAWRVSKAVRALATLPAIHDRLRLAYGRRSFAFQTLSFRSGSQQGLHSDTVHFDSDPPGFMCGVWIALEDVNEDAGPLVYYPGSHRLPVMTMARAGVLGAPTAADYVAHYEPNFRAAVEQSGLPARRLIVPKGWAFVWDANLAHGGAPIAASDTTRRSLVVHCYFEDCVYHTPMRSDEQRGHRYIRLPTDIGTGRKVWPRTNGRRVWPSLLTILKAYGRAIYRKPFVT